jgi:hypothetical protein
MVIRTFRIFNLTASLKYDLAYIICNVPANRAMLTYEFVEVKKKLKNM